MVPLVVPPFVWVDVVPASVVVPFAASVDCPFADAPSDVPVVESVVWPSADASSPEPELSSVLVTFVPWIVIDPTPAVFESNFCFFPFFLTETAVGLLTWMVMESVTVYVFFHGLDYRRQAEDCRLFYEYPEAYGEILQRYGVDYVYVSDYERADFDVDVDALEELWPVVYENSSVKIFKTGAGISG